ncbi:MAG: methylated-DNA--[protein]-cysteine S-methyltransferase [Niabella sp.]
MILTDDIMYNALLKKDASFEGQFFVAVKTTGIFCRPSCTARKPKRENVTFYFTAKECMLNGYRPCMVCKPLEKLNEAPAPVKEVLQQLYEDPCQKISDEDLKAKGIEPNRLRRWFLKQYGITFQAYQRMLRLNAAAKKIQQGETVTGTAFETGFNSLSGFSDSFKNTFGVSPRKGKQYRLIDFKLMDTPLGTMIACADETGVCLLEFAERKNLEKELTDLAKQLNATVAPGQNAHLVQLEEELNEYFAGKRRQFDVALFTPGTDFQKDVWNALQRIPYGTTRSYKEQSISINRPESVRAVANANGMNRIAIVIPCHRVVGTDGTLTGYSGGLWRKKYLLELEAKTINGDQ